MIAVAALSSRWAGHDGIGHRSKQFSFGSWFQCSAGLSPSLMLILHLSDALICMSSKQTIKTQKSWISWRRDGIHMAGIEKIPNYLRIAPKAHSIKVSDLSSRAPRRKEYLWYSIIAHPHPPFDPILQLKSWHNSLQQNWVKSLVYWRYFFSGLFLWRYAPVQRTGTFFPK